MGASRLRILAGALALGFLLALVAGGAGLFGGSRAFAGGTTLTVIGGDVFVRHAAGDLVAAVDGETLNTGDAIRTGADGRAILTYFEGSTVTVEPGTELRIDTASTVADGGTVVLMTQTVGRTWHVVTKLIAGSSKYEVRTPASTASVRGTEFQVDSSSDATTVTTTEGTVVQHVPDPAQPTTTVDVPVPAGTTQTQPRNAPAAPARAAPDPKRKVTVTVGAGNSIVVDPLGRANGLTKDGKVVVQTPGAQVRRDGDRIVITLPDLPDGKLTTRIDKKDDGDNADLPVTARVEEQGKSLDLVDNTSPEGSNKVAGFEIRRRDDGNTGTRPLEDSEKQALPTAKIATARRADPTTSPKPSDARRVPTSQATAAPIRTSDGIATPDVRRTFDLRTLAPRSELRTETPRLARVETPQPSGSSAALATLNTSSGAALVPRLVLSQPLPSSAAQAPSTVRLDSVNSTGADTAPGAPTAAPEAVASAPPTPPRNGATAPQPAPPTAAADPAAIPAASPSAPTAASGATSKSDTTGAALPTNRD